MARIRQGNGYRIPTTVQQRNLDGTYTLVTPTTIAGTLQFPDLTTAPFTPANDGIGLYHSDLSPATLTQLGHYQWEVRTTGPGASTQIGVIDVSAGLAPMHIDFFDAKARLNISSLSDAEIEDMMASAVREQENSVGAVAPRAVTETITASGGRLWPATRPVLSVTSATLNGVAQMTSGWTVRYDVITPATGYLSGDYVTQFVAGRNPVPQDLVEAALLRVQHSYETQRGPAELPLADAVEGGGSSFVLMLRARDKEAPYVLPAVA